MLEKKIRERNQTLLIAGDSISADNASWTFGGDVPKSFDNHVSKSVPMYLEGHELICKYSDYFISDTSVVYDLGTSTGELLLKLAEWHKAKSGLSLIGVDREEAMIQHAKEKCQNDPRIQFLCEEIPLIKLEKSDFIVSYYTMQFIRPTYRQEVFNKIYESLQWGGAFLFFEKVRAPDARFQDINTGLYNDYKLEEGYTSDEILAKSRSLKGVMEPFSTAGNYELLERAGFKDKMKIMKYICFQGILAIK